MTPATRVPAGEPMQRPRRDDHAADDERGQHHEVVARDVRQPGRGSRGRSARARSASAAGTRPTPAPAAAWPSIGKRDTDERERDRPCRSATRLAARRRPASDRDERARDGLHGRHEQPAAADEHGDPPAQRRADHAEDDRRASRWRAREPREWTSIFPAMARTRLRAPVAHPLLGRRVLELRAEADGHRHRREHLQHGGEQRREQVVVIVQLRVVQRVRAQPRWARRASPSDARAPRARAAPTSSAPAEAVRTAACAVARDQARRPAAPACCRTRSRPAPVRAMTSSANPCGTTIDPYVAPARTRRSASSIDGGLVRERGSSASRRSSARTVRDSWAAIAIDDAIGRSRGSGRGEDRQQPHRADDGQHDHQRELQRRRRDAPHLAGDHREQWAAIARGIRAWSGLPRERARAGPTRCTLMPGRSAGRGEVGRARTSNVFRSNPPCALVERQVA